MGLFEQLGLGSGYAGMPQSADMQQQHMALVARQQQFLANAPCCHCGHRCEECIKEQERQQGLLDDLKKQQTVKEAAYQQRCQDYLIKFRAGYRKL